MKKILSLILSFILIFTMALPVFAADTVNQTCPTIYIPGISTSVLYKDRNDTSTAFAYPTVEELTEIIKNDLLPTLLTYIATGNSDPFANEFSDLANYVFADYFNNPDGTPQGNSGAYVSYPSYVSKNSRLIFNYDWRGDPLVIAEELDKFINHVLAKSGSDKVAIQCHSLGSVIATTYLTVYGDDKVMGMVFDSPGLYGVTYVGELLCGNPEIASDALTRSIKDLLGENEYKALISSTLDMLMLTGITDDATGFLNKLIEKASPILYEKTLVPLFACWPTIWALTPDDYIDDGMDYIFSGYTGEDADLLKAKITAYNETVRESKEETLVNFDADSKLAIIARYGYAGLPVTPAWNIPSDTVVDTKSASLGATTAAFGTHFNDTYLEGKDMSLISPDRTIDASTCLFPEKTWFIKNIMHSETDITRPIHSELLFGKEEATVENFRLPRFMIYDASTEALLEDATVFEEPKEETKGGSIFRKVINFFTALFNFFANLFSAKK